MEWCPRCSTAACRKGSGVEVWLLPCSLLHCCDKTWTRAAWGGRKGHCGLWLGSCVVSHVEESWKLKFEPLVPFASEVRKMGVGPSYWAQHPSLCSGSAHSKMALPTSVQLTHLLPLLCPEACLLDDSEIQTRLTISSSYSININPFRIVFLPTELVFIQMSRECQWTL